MSQSVSGPIELEPPSIFALFAEDNLSLTLRNAIKFLLKFFTNRYPNYLYQFRGNLDEIHLLLDLTIQWSYLERWNSTFTERFFSLQRFSSNLTTNKNNGRLNTKQIISSLIVVSVFPYIVGKLDSFFERLRDKQLTIERFSTQTTNHRNIIQLNQYEKLILQYYPMIKQLYQSLQILLWISYSVGNQNQSYHSIPFWLFHRSQKLSFSKDLDQTQNVSNKISKIGIAILLTRFFDATLKSGTFLVQFLEYWYSHTDVRQLIGGKSNNSKIPPPPILSQNKISSLSTELCPLCLQKRVNETALATSGYVFCYLCIFDYVKVYGQCPITRFPSTVQQLVRVFG